ncbi:MAG: hypothetical protein SWE60_00410 [Thermodesulfobacteriota bacterium]|nr:hypothetical protein [Thermodesulfobacteriota bacterium]
MTPKGFFAKAAILLILLGPHAAFCLTGEDLLRLKQAGVSDETIQLMAQEKVIETCAFTVAEIVALKKAGVADETIDLVIQEGSFVRDGDPILYGEATETIRFTSTRDIIDLKQAGVSDVAIQALIATGKSSETREDNEGAWDMLRDMEIIVDTRHRTE